MFAKIKQAFFTDSLTIEWEKMSPDPLLFVLRNDEGKVCSTLETSQNQHQRLIYLTWVFTKKFSSIIITSY